LEKRIMGPGKLNLWRWHMPRDNKKKLIMMTRCLLRVGKITVAIRASKGG